MSAPRLPQAVQMNWFSMSDNRMSSGQRSPFILRSSAKVIFWGRLVRAGLPPDSADQCGCEAARDWALLQAVALTSALSNA